jgi:hypothetical protein
LGSQAYGELADHFIYTGNITSEVLAKANIYIHLDDKCPHYEIKKALMLDSANTKDFNIDENIDSQSSWRLMINYARFVTYKGDPVVLTNANNKACNEEETEYFAVTCEFKEFNGLNLLPIDRFQEIEAWQLIKERT